MKSMISALALTALAGAATISVAQTTAGTRPAPPAGARPASPPTGTPPSGPRPAIAPSGTPLPGGPHPNLCRDLNRPAPPAGATPPAAARVTPPEHLSRADLVALIARLGITCPASDGADDTDM